MKRGDPDASRRNGGLARRRTRGYKVAAWIEANCVFTQGGWIGKPFRLLPWQKRLLLELFEPGMSDSAVKKRTPQAIFQGVPPVSGSFAACITTMEPVLCADQCRRDLDVLPERNAERPDRLDEALVDSGAQGTESRLTMRPYKETDSQCQTVGSEIQQLIRVIPTAARIRWPAATRPPRDTRRPLLARPPHGFETVAETTCARSPRSAATPPAQHRAGLRTQRERLAPDGAQKPRRQRGYIRRHGSPRPGNFT